MSGSSESFVTCPIGNPQDGQNLCDASQENPHCGQVRADTKGSRESPIVTQARFAAFWACPPGVGTISHVSRQRLGELLVASNVISEADLEKALATPRQAGQRLGDVLIQMGLVSEAQLTQILGQQHSVPWVSLYHIDFSRQLLNLISRELADRYCLVPIYVRRVRRQDTLYVAMDDPSNEAALAEVAKVVGLPVKPMIAAPSDIRNAIRVYYGAGPAPAAAPLLTPARAVPPAPQTTPGLSPLAMSAPPGPIQSIPPDEVSAAEIEDEEAAPSTVVEKTKTDESPAAVEEAPPTQTPLSQTAEQPVADAALLRAASGDSPDAEPEIEASEVREVAIPLKPKFGGPMVAITMLDGTTIQLPARKKKKEPEPDDEEAPPSEMGGLTARDLVAALRAVSQGRDAKAVLGDDTKWEKLFATLLSILLKKGLIADWEFIDELRKM